MKAIVVLALKDIRILLRDKAGFFFTFFFPLLLALFFGTIFSGGGGGGGSNAISILVVDKDSTKKSNEFVAMLDTASELKVTHISSRKEAVSLVRQGKSVAYVLLKPGFGEKQEKVFWGGPPEIELGVDPSRKAEAGMLKGILTKYAVVNLEHFFSDRSAMQQNARAALDSVKAAGRSAESENPGLERFLGELNLFLGEDSTWQENSAGGESQSEGSGFSGMEPLRIEENEVAITRNGPNNYYAVSFPQGIIWGIIGCTIAFGISLVVERNNGTLMRLRTAPIRRYQILGGKALACFMTIISISVLLFGLAILIFGVRPGSYSHLIMAVVSASIGFVGIMMFLSVLGRTEQAASGISWAVMMVLAMLGGGMIPIFIMPGWLQSMSHFSPVKWAMLAMEGAIWRQFSLQEMFLPCGILLAVGVVFFAIGVRAFRWSEEL